MMVVFFAFTTILLARVLPGKATPTSFEIEGSDSGDFSWKNCNKIPVLIKIEELNISKPKIKLGELFWMNATVELNEGVGENGTAIQVEASLKMKIDGEYSELCNLAPPGFCYFPNFCDELDRLSKHCPNEFKEVFHNCTCPFERKYYKITNYPVVIQKPPFSIQGQFQTTIVIREMGRDIGCILIYFQIID